MVYKMRRNASFSLFATILLSFTILAIVSYVNNGYHIEMGLSIDVNHHVWFSKHVIHTDRLPHDNAYEYMPLALLIVPILSLVNGMYHPIYILLRTFLAQLVYIIITWLIIQKKSHHKFSHSLILMLTAFPISLAFYPYYLTINHVIVPITLLNYIVIKSFDKNSFLPSTYILYVILCVASLLSNFSYTLILLVLFFGSLYLHKVYNKIFSVKVFSINMNKTVNKLLFMSMILTSTYVTYVIMTEATSYSFSIKRSLSAFLTLINQGSIEPPLKKSQISLDYVTLIVSVMKLYGTLLVPYSLIILFAVINFLKKRILMPLHITVFLSFILTTLLALTIGYDAFRLINIVNLLLPFALCLGLNALRVRLRIKIFVLCLVLVGLAFLSIIHFTPIDVKVNVMYYEPTRDNTTVIESISVIEHYAQRPLVYAETLRYLSNHLGAAFPYIIGDRTICHGFMYVNRRDLYLSCKSLSSAVNIIMDDTQVIRGYVFGSVDQPSLFVINYPVKFMTEEPIEYRSNSLRKRLISPISLVYNSGAMAVCATDI